MTVDLSGASWRKSSVWHVNGRVEVAFVGDQVVLRDCKDPEGSVFRFTAAEWEAFLTGVRNGEFDETRRGTDMSPQHDEAEQFPHGVVTSGNPTARALGYFTGLTAANTTVAGVAAARIDPFPSTVWVLGVLGMQIVSGLFAFLTLKSIQKKELELAKLKYRYEEQKNLYEALWKLPTEGAGGDNPS